MKDINITAKNLESFKKAEELLKKLPESISCQIESAKFGGVGLDCVIEDKFKDNQHISLPNKVTQISDFDNYTGIYCGEYFFKLTNKLYERKHKFLFIECKDL